MDLLILHVKYNPEGIYFVSCFDVNLAYLFLSDKHG